MTELWPAPNSASSRSATAADSASASSQPPELRALAVCDASVIDATASTTARIGDGSSEAVDEGFPSG